MGRISSRFGSRAKHHRPLRPLLESLERRDLLASFATLEDKPLVVSDPTLANIVIVSNPTHGTVSRTDLGGFVYKPAENYNGTDSFVYGTGGTATNTTVGETVTASITVTPVNDAPSGADKAITLLEDSSYTLQTSDFGFTDPKDNNNFQAVRISSIPEQGKLFNTDLPVVSGQIISVGDIVNNRFRYVPPANSLPATNANTAPSARFTFQVQDDGGTANGGVNLDQSPNTITLSVTPVNDAPTGTDSTRNLPQNAAYFLQPFDFGFIDPNDVPSNALRAVTIVTLPTKGQLQDNGVPVVAGQSIPVSEFVSSTTAGAVQGSRVKYVPDTTSDGLGTFSFTFAVQDNGGTANGGVDTDPTPNTFTITVKPVEQPKPEARGDFYSLFQNGTLTIGVPGVLGNDSGINGRPLTASLEPEKGPQHGTVELYADGSFTYKPATGYVGIDTFVYRATDVSPAANPLPPTSSTAIVTINVKPNPAIIANPDLFETRINVALDIAPPGVLKNDYVIVGDPVTNANGTVGTSPNYPLTAVLVSQPINGTVELKPDGSLHYVPKANFTGTDTFTYRAALPATTAATDQNAATRDLATVTINVKPFAASPVAFDDLYSTIQNTPLRINAPGVLSNDTKEPGATLSALIGSRPSHGDIEFHADGSFVYTPTSGFTGTDTFTYQDLELLGTQAPPSGDPNQYISNFATVTINVRPLNIPPVVVANNDVFETKANTVIEIGPPGVLKNDYVILADPSTGVTSGTTSASSNYPLIALVLNRPANGELELHGDGSFRYVPKANFVGVDTFTYQAAVSATSAADPNNTARAVATVTINVRPIVVPPVAVNDEFHVKQDTVLVADPPGVLANDKPIEGHRLVAKLQDNVLHGTLNFTESGGFTYTPASGYSGLDTFTYYALDVASNDTTANPLRTNLATVTIFVKAPEPLPGPVAVNDFYFTAENTALGIGLPGVLANDYVRGGVDPSTGTTNLPSIKLPLTSVLVAGPANGVISLNSDGSFKYLPNKDFVGTDTFTYQDILSTTVPTLNGTTATDFAPVMSNIATVTIRVVPAVAHNDNYTTDRDKPLEIIKPGVLANDSGGSEAHPLTATLLSGPLHGTLKLQSDGSFRYEPVAGYVGADTFTYRASDGQPAIDPSTGVLTTTATNGDANRPINAYDIGVVKIYVRPTITVPAIQAHDDKFPALKNTTLTIDSPGVLANDYGPVNVPVVAAVADKPLHGTLTLNEKGGFTYVPEADFVGEDKFTYTANVAGAIPGSTNSTIQGGLATVTIYVMAPQSPPAVIIGRNQTTTDESGPQRVTDFAAIVAVGNDGQPMAISVTTDKPSLFQTPPAIDAAGQLIYTPAPNASGTATITVNVGDPSFTETFTIQIDKPHALYNAALPCDVTGDTTVAADDALAVINYINAQGDNEADALSPAALPAGGKHLYYDVDKDDTIAAIDVLLIINHINAQSNPIAATPLSADVDSSLLALVAQDAADATTGKRKI